MIKEYGMSSRLGQVYFERERRQQFLNIPVEGARQYSEATAREIDAEVQEIIENEYNRAVMDAGASALLEKEKLEGEDMERLKRQVIVQKSEAAGTPSGGHD
jgi:cell division protease FtsH